MFDMWQVLGDDGDECIRATCVGKFPSPSLAWAFAEREGMPASEIHVSDEDGNEYPRPESVPLAAFADAWDEMARLVRETA